MAMPGTFWCTLPVKAVHPPIGYGNSDHGNDDNDEEVPFTVAPKRYDQPHEACPVTHGLTTVSNTTP